MSLILTKIRLKLHIYFILSIKKEIVDSIIAGLSLSLDVLIYIIRCSKPESDDYRFNLQSSSFMIACLYTWLNVNLNFTE